MHDDIIAFLKNHPEGVSSLDLANSILKMTNASQALAEQMIKGILSKDCRCQKDNNGLWRVRTTIKSDNYKSFKESQLTAVFIIPLSLEAKKQITYLSLWDLIPEPHYKWGVWLTDPNELSACEQQTMVMGPDCQFDSDNVETTAIRVANDLKNAIPIFFNSYNYNLLRQFCMNYGICLTDDVMLICDFLKVTDITTPKPLNMLTLQKAVFNTAALPSSPYKQGEAFAECVSELIKLLMERGITCREQMEELLISNSKFFVNKAYDYSLINSLSTTLGVYGFQDKSGKYIYIGRAQDLRRRISNYFRDTEGVSKKLQQLHTDAYSLTTVSCGSELECLILENRLIDKHTPYLNSKRKINDSKDVLSIDDCIVLLPHTDHEFIMSFWFRKNQKIQLKKISVTLEQDTKLVDELDAFFFSSKVSISNQNLFEQEISSKWVKTHSEYVPIVLVNKMENAQELFDALLGYIQEVNLT